MKVFYHGDADGKCAAYWVRVGNKRACPYPTEFIEMQYSTLFPLDSIRRDELVYIVDFSIHPYLMRALLDRTQNVVWIDHHANAISQYDDFGVRIDGLRNTDYSGCMLTYVYLTRLVRPDGQEKSTIDDWIADLDILDSIASSAPEFTKLIDDYDTWKFKYGDKTKQFQAAFDAHDFHPESYEWGKLRSYLDYYVNAGKHMIEYRNNLMDKIIKKTRKDVELMGHKGLLINTCEADGNIFIGLVENYDFWGWWYLGEGGMVKVSIRSNKMDVSELARQFGGNGHKGAAGFTVDLRTSELSWLR